MIFNVYFRSKRRSNINYSEADNSNGSEQHSITLLKRFRQNLATDCDVPPAAAADSSSASDEKWWRDYLERKLDLEREKMRREDDRHRDLMNFHKMSLIAQEKSTKIKVDAMNSLMDAFTKLVETKFK